MPAKIETKTTANTGSPAIRTIRDMTRSSSCAQRIESLCLFLRVPRVTLLHCQVAYQQLLERYTVTIEGLELEGAATSLPFDQSEGILVGSLTIDP